MFRWSNYQCCFSTIQLFFAMGHGDPSNWNLTTQWNVTPLLGDFGGRVGINRFLLSPPIPRMLPFLFICGDFFSLFVPSTVCMHTCRPKDLPEGLQWVHALGEVPKKRKNRRVWNYNSLICYKFFEWGVCLRKFP